MLGLRCRHVSMRVCLAIDDDVLGGARCAQNGAVLNLLYINSTFNNVSAAKFRRRRRMTAR